MIYLIFIASRLIFFRPILGVILLANKNEKSF